LLPKTPKPLRAIINSTTNSMGKTKRTPSNSSESSDDRRNAVKDSYKVKLGQKRNEAEEEKEKNLKFTLDSSKKQKQEDAPKVNPLTNKKFSQKYYQILEKRKELPAWEAR